MIAHVTPDDSGRWLAVVGPAGALLVAHAEEHADALLAALSASDPVQPVLDVLAGSGVSVAPDFALVLVDETGRPRHAVVRGSVVVRTSGETGPDELTGRGARTWMEHATDAVAAELVAPGAAEAPALPLERGAVRGARIALGASGATPTTTSAAPATSAPAAAPTAAASPMAPAAAPVPPVAAPVAPAPPVVAVAPPVAEHTIAEPLEGALGYDHLFEATIVRPLEEAAVRPGTDEESEPAPAAAPVPDPAPVAVAPVAPGATPDPADPAGPGDAADAADGDHDGETVLSGTIPGRSDRPRPAAAEIAPVPATARFALVLPGGRREPIVGELVLGRAPTARVVDGRMPRLVTLDGDPDVSRSHVRIALEGDTVVVTDLRSRNGTSVVLPGKPPQLLRADEPTPVIPGTVVDLGATQLVVEEETGPAAGADA